MSTDLCWPPIFDVVGSERYRRPAPLTPAAMARLVARKRFTSKKGDLPMVIALNTRTILSIFRDMKELKYADVGWGDDEAVQLAEVLPLWKEFRACYQSEAAAIAAAKKQPLVILPFFNKAENIRLCWRILSEEIGFSDAERREIVTSYPGVLANKPYELATSSMDEVRFSVRLASAVDSVPEEVRFAVPTVTTRASSLISIASAMVAMTIEERALGLEDGRRWRARVELRR